MAKKNVIEQMIGMLRTPIAQRKGVVIPPYECAIWAEELERYLVIEKEKKDQLETKEVDLEKEIKEQIDTYYENCNKKLEEMGEDDNDISFLTLDGFARHFYELGLKAKGE